MKRTKFKVIVEGLEQSQKAGREAEGQSPADKDTRWLLDVVASVSNRSRSEISQDTRLADLGFDSLMFVELATAIENAGGAISAPERFNEIQDVKELIAVVGKSSAATRAQKSTRSDQEVKADDEIHIPSLVRTIGNKGLDVVQKAFYERFLRTHYEGQTNIPAHTNFIVAANHSSHLDMGLAKMALGAAGKDMVALAAADYFFDNKYKRAYMENFTNLVPMERTGSLRQSLRHATSFLDRGYNALIFPEGTRSMTGLIGQSSSL